MKTFDPQVLAADLIEVRKIFAAFFAERTHTDWEQHTEKFNQGWTLRETVAHLDAVGQVYQHAIISTLAGKLCEFPGMTKREDLPTWNRREIEARLQIPISTICDSFLNGLQQAADLAAHLDPATLTKHAPVPFYHRPMTIGELLGGQAAHPGLVHAAQVANGARIPPLWQHYNPELLFRQYAFLSPYVPCLLARAGRGLASCCRVKCSRSRRRKLVCDDDPGRKPGRRGNLSATNSKDLVSECRCPLSGAHSANQSLAILTHSTDFRMGKFASRISNGMAIQPRLDPKLTTAQPVLHKPHEDLIAKQASAFGELLIF